MDGVRPTFKPKYTLRHIWKQKAGFPYSKKQKVASFVARSAAPFVAKTH